MEEVRWKKADVRWKKDDVRSLREGGCRQVFHKKNAKLFAGNKILRLATAKSENSGKDVVEKLRARTAISPASTVEPWQTPATQLFYKLSATHLVYLSNTKDPLKRASYEQEAIRGCWTVKELDRQVSSQYYERMGLSNDKKALQRLTAKENQRLILATSSTTLLRSNSSDCSHRMFSQKPS